MFVKKRSNKDEAYAHQYATQLASICQGSNVSCLVIKYDQETLVGALVGDIKAMWSDSRTIVECSPIRNPKSNGMVERIVMNVKERVEGMKSAIESKWQNSIKDIDHLVTRIVEYCAVSRTRSEVSKDGKPAYACLNRKRGVVLDREFDEKIMSKSDVCRPCFAYRAKGFSVRSDQ